MGDLRHKIDVSLNVQGCTWGDEGDISLIVQGVAIEKFVLRGSSYTFQTKRIL
ncbi:MAG: hypothetical protein MRK02_06200 [Candidatus Scalindua sp.]|nr:hypothetical protein [Candidatus Scalindua sp.]